MEMVYYTVVAVILYFVSDWLLNRIEHRAGHRLEHRTLYFFGILVTLALLSFAAIRQVTSGV
jgi:hypothetical protein